VPQCGHEQPPGRRRSHGAIDDVGAERDERRLSARAVESTSNRRARIARFLGASPVGPASGQSARQREPLLALGITAQPFRSSHIAIPTATNIGEIPKARIASK
jgi:hypothetical protein